MDSIIQLRLNISGTDYIVPTFENTSLQITRSVQSLETLSSAQSTLTEQSFRVPLNKELIEAIGDLADPKEDGEIDLRKTIDGYILIDGIDVYEGGFTVLSVTQNPLSDAREVELLFRGNESSLKAKLEQVKLKNLLDGETLDYTIEEIKDYYNAPSTYISTNGYTWDLIDYGQDFIADGGTGLFGTGKRIDDDTSPLSQLDFKPSITIQKIFDLIETDQGITWTNDSSIDELFDQIIPLHNNESNLPVLDTSPNDYTGYMNRTNTLAYNVNNDTTSAAQLMNFNNAVNYNQTVFNVGSGFDRYTVPTGVNGVFNFRLDYEFDITNSGVTGGTNIYGDVRIYIYKNGSAIGSYLSNQFVNTSGLSANVEGSYSFELNLVATDYIDARLVFVQYSVPVDASYTMTYTQTAASQLICTKSPAYTSNSQVLIGSNIDQDLTAWDVVRTVISQCNGIVTRDGSNYDITAWANWVDNNTDIVNINAKLDASSDIKIEPTSVTGAKSLRFTYEEGDDYLNQKFRELQSRNYGELYIADTGSDFATKEYEIKLPFCNAVPYPIPSSTTSIVRMVDDEGELIKNKPMLIPKANYSRYQKIELQDVYGGTAYTYYFIPATVSWYDSYNGGFTEKDLNFGTSLNFFAVSGFPNNTLYERFWRRYVREVYGLKSRKYEMNIKVTPTEFQTWLLNEKLLFKGAYFRFNSIQNYNLNKKEPVKVEMIKRIDIENSDIAPYYPYDVINGVVQWKDSSDNSDVGDGSTEPIADIEASCIAYGFFYDDTNVSGGAGAIGIQVGQILTIN